MNKTAELTSRLAHQLAIINDAGYATSEDKCILDFGCGEGNSVHDLRKAGYEAFGCDVEMWSTPRSKELVDSGLLREVSFSPYRLPFENEMFDIVLSNEVFEHVQNYPETLAELHRVMKPGAISLHLFPARWIPVEPHVKVPFASVIRSYAWLRFWSMLGLRNPHQQGLGARETASRNLKYLTHNTIYLSSSDIVRQFRAFFPTVRFAEHLFIKHSMRGRKVYRYARRLPFLFRLYRACWNRVILAGK